MVAFAAFVAIMAVTVIGAAVLLVVSIAFSIGLMIFVPGVVAAVGIGAVAWGWGFIGCRVGLVAWRVYSARKQAKEGIAPGATSSPSASLNGKKGNGAPVASTEQKKKKENGIAATDYHGQLSAGDSGYDEKRPTSASSLASSTVRVESEGETEGETEGEGGYTHGEGKVKSEFIGLEDRDEDRVGRDIARSLG